MKYSKPRTRTFSGNKNNYSVRFPEDLYEYFKEVAEKSGRGIADVMADVLDEAATQWKASDQEHKSKSKPQ